MLAYGEWSWFGYGNHGLDQASRWFPSQLLRCGGTADAARVETAFRIILKDPGRSYFGQYFWRNCTCDRVAQGIVDAYKNMGDAINVPIIVRLQGTNADIAKELIDNLTQCTLQPHSKKRPIKCKKR